MDVLIYILSPLLLLAGPTASRPVSLACPVGQMAAMKAGPEPRMILVNQRWELTEDAYECVVVDADGNVPGTGGISGTRGGR